MKFIKNLFKKQPSTEQLNIELPFERGAVNFPDIYAFKLVSILENEGDLEYLKTDGQFELIFGTKDTTHILLYSYTCVLILFEPEKDGWTATRVYINHTDHDANPAYDKMTFLFKIPNMLFGEDPYTDDGVAYTYPEYASVYAYH